MPNVSDGEDDEKLTDFQSNTVVVAGTVFWTWVCWYWCPPLAYVFIATGILFVGAKVAGSVAILISSLRRRFWP